MSRGQASDDKLSAAAAKAKAVQLRMAGFTITDIAEQIGKSKSQTHRYLKSALEDYARDAAEAAQELVAIQEARIERMIRGLWSKAIQGQVGATDRVIKLLERQAKLHGLDKPTKIAPTNPGGDGEYNGGGLSALLQKIDGSDSED